MIVPRFTVRRLLAITAVAAVFFAINSAACRGLRDEAIANSSSMTQPQIDERVQKPAFVLAAVSVGLWAVVATALFFAALFVMAFLAAEVIAAMTPRRAAQSPFAQHTPAPQLLPPEEPT